MGAIIFHKQSKNGKERTLNNPIWRTTDPRNVIYDTNGINGYCILIANRLLVGNVVTRGDTVLRNRKRQLKIFDRIMKKWGSMYFVLKGNIECKNGKEGMSD